jgi:hypothetical protein
MARFLGRNIELSYWRRFLHRYDMPRANRYIELNMVRCGEVAHPSQWEWSGYREMVGARKRNQLLETVAKGDAWVLREQYEPDFGPENRPMMCPEPSES